MFAGREIPISMMWKFTRFYLIFFIIYSSLICFLFDIMFIKAIAIPFMPLSVIGIGVAFYVGFKNNASYERLWEARRIWGSIVNDSRNWTISVLHFITNSHAINHRTEAELYEIKKDLIYRNIAYVNSLRILLRKKSVWQGMKRTDQQIINEQEELSMEELDKMMFTYMPPSEACNYIKYSNPASQILNTQAEKLKQLKEEGLIEDFRHIELHKLIMNMFNYQGGCERIKNFPFPRQYAYFSLLFVWIFILLLPFAMVGEFDKLGSGYVWVLVPFYTLISWIFMTMEQVGDSSENPFENGLNDVPMTAICRTIEIDTREMLGDTNIPGKIEAVNNILM